MTQNATESRSMIDARQAVKIARDYMQSFFDGEELNEFRLEEIQRSEDGKYWLITFGYDTNRLTAEPELQIHTIIQPNRPKYVRDYKVVTVDASSGEVESMKIRNI